MSSTSSRNNVLFGLMKDVSEAIRLDRSEKNEVGISATFQGGRLKIN